MSYEIMPSVQTALEVFPEKKKDTFDRVMEVAHLLMDGTVGTVVNGMNAMLQTYALIQGRRDARKIIKYTSDLEQTKSKMYVELMRLDNEAKRDWYQYDLQKSSLTLYIDKQYQRTVDQITKTAQSASHRIEFERCKAIKEIDDYTMSVTKGMDWRYREMLRQEEAVCAVYRNFIHDMTKQGINRQDIACRLGLQAINSHNLSDNQFRIIIDAVCKMTEPSYVTFDQFVSIHNRIKQRSIIDY